MNSEHYHDPTAERAMESQWKVVKIGTEGYNKRYDERMKRNQVGKAERKRQAEEQHKAKVKRQNLLLHEKVLMLERMKVNLAKLEQTIDEYAGIIDPAEARQRKRLKGNASEFITRYEAEVKNILANNGGI